MRGLLALVVLTGCEHIFDLDDPHQEDASVVVPTCPGHDEDGDGVADVCDVCPAVTDGEQHDEDHDGVGDACDPDPMRPNAQVVFDPFTSSEVLTDWRPTAGTSAWVAGNDAITINESSSAKFFDLVFQPNVPVAPFVMSAVIDLKALDGSSIFELGTDFSADGTMAVGCGITGYGATQAEDTLTIRSDHAPTLTSDQPVPTLPEGVYTLTFTYRRGGVSTCRLDGDAGPQQTAAMPTGRAGGAIGLLARHVRLSVRSVVVYTLD